MFGGLYIIYILFGIIWIYLVILPRIGGTIYGTFLNRGPKTNGKKNKQYFPFTLWRFIT